jgi:hypothetical protein
MASETGIAGGGRDAALGAFAGSAASSFETHAARAPQDEVLNPHGEERGNAARLEPWPRELRTGFDPIGERSTVSDVCSAAISRQRGIEGFDQGRSGEGLGQKADCSGLQRSGADAVIGEGRYENERRSVTLGAQEGQQVQTAHGGHLYIRDHARGVLQVGRLQELLGRRKSMDHVSMRPQKIVGRGADGCVVVNDGNSRV